MMIFLIIAISLFARIISLNQSLWLDEASTDLAAGIRLKDYLTGFLPDDFHPPLYYLLMRLWVNTFGNSEIILRLPSVIFGVLNVLVVFLIAKEIVKHSKLKFWHFPEISALLMATSSLAIYYSQEARMYSLASLLVSLTFYFFTKIIFHGRAGDFMLFGVSLALSLFTDYIPVLMLPVFWSGALLMKKGFAWWRKFFMSHIVLVVTGLAYLPIFLKQIKGGLLVETSLPGWWQILGQVSLKNVLLIPTKFVLGRIGFENDIVYLAIAATFCGTYLFLLLRALRSTERSTKLFWVWLLIPCTLSVLVSFKIPVLSYFRLLFVLPAFYLLTAYGISTLSKYKKVALSGVLIINLLTSGYYLFSDKFHREDWRGLVRYINMNKNAGAETLFLTSANWEAYRYYNPDAKITSAPDYTFTAHEVWLMRYLKDIYDPNDGYAGELEAKGYIKTEEANFRGVSAWKYIKK